MRNSSFTLDNRIQWEKLTPLITTTAFNHCANKYSRTRIGTGAIYSQVREHDKYGSEQWLGPFLHWFAGVVFRLHNTKDEPSTRAQSSIQYVQLPAVNFFSFRKTNAQLDLTHNERPCGSSQAPRSPQLFTAATKHFQTVPLVYLQDDDLLNVCVWYKSHTPQRSLEIRVIFCPGTYSHALKQGYANWNLWRPCLRTSGWAIKMTVRWQRQPFNA